LISLQVFGTPRNISIPDGAFSNGKGSFSFQLPIAKGSQFVMVMSDATGFNTGGTTQVLTAKDSTSGQQCDTSNPSEFENDNILCFVSEYWHFAAVVFSFQLNTALQQCRYVAVPLSKCHAHRHSDPSLSALSELQPSRSQLL
jgi:hypothetical protein